ncbi:MAG: OmpA family protein [Myxococcaceae bacterium]|nr:OmpA family protein [Myxococcaceae bacterium]
MRRHLVFFVLPACLSAVALAEPLVVQGRKKEQQIVFPLGPASFADRVVSTKPGAKLKGKKGQPPAFDAEVTLGLPDKKALTLGCGGSVTLEFTDNVVVDLPGNDLYVFEEGPDVEPTLVELSVDGTTFVELGRIEGGTREVDLAGKVPEDTFFHFVRLTDVDARRCGGQYPGADLDAVGVMGAAFQLQLSAEVLFDTGKAQLRPDGEAALREVVGKVQALGKAKLRVLGHTDAQGTSAANSKLSEARAQSVVRFLSGLSGLEGVPVDGKGYGETRPVALNDTAEGRQKNRRVEVLVIPVP